MSEKSERERQERWDRANNFPIGQGWNVTLDLFYADDYAVFVLNGDKVLDLSFGEKKKEPVALQSLLQNGQNTLRVICYNYHPQYWSFRYRIGVFDAAGKPTMDAIDLSPKGVTPIRVHSTMSSIPSRSPESHFTAPCASKQSRRSGGGGASCPFLRSGLRSGAGCRARAGASPSTRPWSVAKPHS